MPETRAALSTGGKLRPTSRTAAFIAQVNLLIADVIAVGVAQDDDVDPAEPRIVCTGDRLPPRRKECTSRATSPYEAISTLVRFEFGAKVNQQQLSSGPRPTEEHHDESLA